jgi:hypothetical protein
MGSAGPGPRPRLAKRIRTAISAKTYLKRTLQRVTDSTVRAGPFAGMKYVETSCGSAYVPKLLGIYELELHGWFEDLARRKPDVFVDVGAAEGYYAVGFAMRNADVPVIAFETTEEGQAYIREMASKNGVGATQLSVHGHCGPVDLERALEGRLRPAVLCDVEGGEVDLLDPEKIHALQRATILCEMHDRIAPEATRIIIERFSRTHSIDVRVAEPRPIAGLAKEHWSFRFVGMRALRWGVSEWRQYNMHWLYLTPRDER